MPEEVETIRGGRAVIPPTQSQVIIKGGLTGQNSALYRIVNGGQSGETIVVNVGGAINLLHKCSIDVVVKTQDVTITAGTTFQARVVYELIEIFDQ